MPGSTTGNILCHFLTMGQTTQYLYPRNALLAILLLGWCDGAGNLLSYRQQYSSSAAGSTSSLFWWQQPQGDGRSDNLCIGSGQGKSWWLLLVTPERGTKPKAPPALTAARIWQQVWGLLCLRMGLYCSSTPMLAILQTCAQLWKGLHQVFEWHPEHRHCIEITLERWSDEHTGSSSPK